jgi:hypothetical protein
MTDPPIVRTSERKAWRRCPKAWEWGWVKGLRSGRAPATALWFGSGVHEALANYYDGGFYRGEKPSKFFANWAGDEIRQLEMIRSQSEDGIDFEIKEYVDAKELGVSLLDRYIDYYGEDSDKETLAVEQAFQVEIVDGPKGNQRVIAIFVGTFDGVFLDHTDGSIYLWEHKTANRVATAFLRLDDQAGGYYAVANIVLHHQGVLNKNERVEGVLYNYLKKQEEDERAQDERGQYLNLDGKVSKRQPGPTFQRELIDRNKNEVATQIRRLRDEVKIMNGMRDGSLPIIKNTAWDCPRCQFFSPCVLEEKNPRAAREYIAQNYTEYDPYADHRKSAAE